MKFIKSLILFILLGSMPVSYILCSKENTEEKKMETSGIQKVDSEYIEMNNKEALKLKNVSSSYGIRLSDEKKVLFANSKELHIVNPTNDEVNDKIFVQNKNFFIGEVVGNNDFIVWQESNSEGIGEGFQATTEFSLYVKNFETGKISLIEEVKKEKSSEILVSTFFDIDGNNLVYIAYDAVNEEFESKVVHYDLQKHKKNIIAKRAENTDQIHYEPHISGENIIYVLAEDYNSDFNTRMTHKISNVILYNIKSKESKKITNNLTISTANIHKDRVIFGANTDETDMFEDSAYYYEISTGKTYNIFYKESKARKFLADRGVDSISIEAIEANDKYLNILYVSDLNYLVYDFEKNKFLNLENIFYKEFNGNIGGLSFIGDDLIEATVKNFDMSFEDQEVKKIDVVIK